MTKQDTQLLMAKIDSVKELLETKLSNVESKIVSIEADVKENTQLRQNIKGIIGLATVISTAFGGALVSLYIWLKGKI